LRSSDKAKFSAVNLSVQEDEHSLEMHLPYAKLIGSDNCTIVPIMVGEINDKTAQAYAEVLQPYFNQPNTVFLVSSDFCHWGKRFDYTYYKKEDGQIFQSIAKLDQRAMDIIQSQDGQGFDKYLQETDNTICGRNPIKLLLRVSILVIDSFFSSVQEPTRVSLSDILNPAK